MLKPLCNPDKPPVIIVDYIQIIPSDKDIKSAVDETLRKLKVFQRDTKSTIFAVSSFNRSNYAASVSFESFKESGSIEYTADVVWAFQLYALKKIKGGADISKAREIIDAAKKRHPRQIQLKCLKNRQGSNYDCFFEYFAANDTFVACTEFDDCDDTDEQSRQIDEVLKHAGGADNAKSHSKFLK